MASILPELTQALAGRYDVEREAGAGGMALVYRALDLKHDRPVALKVLRPELASQVGADRFLREIRLTARLLHPHILPLYDSGEAGGFIYYVMPFVQGETLEDRLARENRLPVDEAVRITRDVASALAHAHEHGVVHRDVKPANILFESGKAVVADFGIARVVEEASAPSITSTGVIVGTPLYMSPEQATGEPLDGRSDIYALGAILYEMLTGEPPYTGPNAAVIIARRITDPVAPVQEARPEVPDELAATVAKALERSPDDRYQTAGELEEALGGTPAPNGASGAKVARDRGAHATTTGGAAGARRRVAALTVRSWPLGVVGVLGLAAVAFLLRESLVDLVAPDPGLGVPTIRSLTVEPGPELFPALSPSGDRVVYARDGDLRLRELGTGSDGRLTDAPEHRNRQPAFAPDGASIVFRSEREGGGLFTLALEDGAEPVRLTSQGYNPTWSPDGTRVAFAEEDVAVPTTRRGVSRLFVVDVETGEERQVGNWDAVQPSWSPDGGRIAFWSVMRDGRIGAQRDLWTISVDGGEPVPVTDDPPVDWNPVWSADGRHLLFSSDRGGGMNLWSIRVDQETGRPLGDPESVTSGGSASREHLTVAAVGGLAVYTERLTTANVWRVPFDPETGDVTGDAESVTTGARMAMEPSVSPDGSRVVFYTLDDAVDLFVAETDGSGVQRITSGPERDRSPQWSPDGARIAMHSNRGGSYQVWTVAPDGSEATQVTRSGNLVIYPFWSPRGDRIGYVELAQAIVAVDPAGARGGGEALLRGDLMVRPQWSPDGRRIAGVLPPSAGGTGIVVYDLDAPGRPTTVSTFGDAPQWLPDGRRLLFAWQSGLWLGDIDGGEATEVVSFGRDQIGLGSLSRDGRWIYFSRTVNEADLWTVAWR